MPTELSILPSVPTIEQFTAHVPGIKEALARSFDVDTFQDLGHAISRGEVQVWGGEDAVIITQLFDNPRPHIHGWVATGKLPAVLELAEDILAWAAMNGIHEATINGRKGWLRVLKTRGWKPLTYTMHLDNRDGAAVRTEAQ